MGTPLKYLKQAHVRLNDSDLSAIEPVEIEAQDGGGGADGRATVVKAVASPMTHFGVEMDALDAYVASSQLSNRVARGFVGVAYWGLLALPVLFLAVAAFRRVTDGKWSKDVPGNLGALWTLAAKTLPSHVPAVAGVLLLYLALVTFARSWGMVLEGTSKEVRYVDGQLAPLRKIRGLVSEAFPIGFANASDAGDVKAFIGARTAAVERSADFAQDIVDTVGGASAASCSGPGAGGHLDPCEMPISACDLNGLTMSVTSVVENYRTACRPRSDAMFETLGDVKADVDQYDRAALWAQISDGVRAILQVVSKKYDVDPTASASSSSAPLQPGDALAIVRDEILPILSLPVVEVVDVAPTPSAQAQAEAEDADAVGTKTLCWQTCAADETCRWAYFDGASTCRIRRSSASKEPSSSGGRPSAPAPSVPQAEFAYAGTPADRPGDGDPGVLVRRHGRTEAPWTSKNAPAPTADATTYVTNETLGGADVDELTSEGDDRASGLAACSADAACVGTQGDEGTLLGLGKAGTTSSTGQGQDRVPYATGQGQVPYATGQGQDRVPYATAFAGKANAGTAFAWKTSDDGMFASNADSFAPTFARMSAYLVPHMADAVLAVCRRHGYQVHPDTYRQQIVDGLVAYYGDVQFARISPTIAQVLSRVSDALAAREAPGQQGDYIDAGRAAAKLRAFTATDWQLLSTSVSAMRVAARTYNARFLPYAGSAWPDVADFMTTMASVAGTVALALVWWTLIARARRGEGDRGGLVRLALLAGCAYAFAVVVFGSFVQKARVRSEHNRSVADANATAMLASMDALSVVVSTDSGWAQAHGSSEGITDAQASAFLGLCVDVVGAYDACNSLVDGGASMPFPTVDVVVFVGAIAALVALTASAVAALRPGVARANIVELRKLRRGLVRPVSLAAERAQVENIDELLFCLDPWRGRESAGAKDALINAGVGFVVVLNIYLLSTTAAANAGYASAVALATDCL